MSSNSEFANDAIFKFLSNKDISLSLGISSIKADDSKSKDEPVDKKTTAEKESKAESAYEDYLENWQQGDPLPLLPPGKQLILCSFNLDPLSEKTAGYFDVPELTKKPYKKSSPEEQLISFKNLGPKLSENLMSLIGRVAKSRGLIVDDKNKLRCPPGTPAANQFTDITGSNCLIPSPQTAAGSARRAVRRAVNTAEIMSSPLGSRTDVSSAGTEQRVQSFTTSDFQMIHSAMGVGGRIGMPGQMLGPVWERGKAVREARKGDKNESFQLSAREQRERAQIATAQADVLHRRFMGQDAPVGITRASRRSLRAMDRQIATPSNYLLPSGNPVGDIINKGNFMRAMKELFPNVDPNEIENLFDKMIPAGLSVKERLEVQRVNRAIFEALIFEAIQNPDHFKWFTRMNVGMIDGNPLTAAEMKLVQFAPSPLAGGRSAGTAVTNLARNPKSQVGERGGLHFEFNFNPMAAYLYTRGAKRSKYSDGSGELGSIEGRAHYLGVHEAGHVVDFGEKLKALGLNPNTLNRYPRSTTLVSTSSGPARQPNFYVNGWEIDWSMIRNPQGNASVQELIDASNDLQTTSYTGSRFGGRRIDLQDNLNKFHLAFQDAFTNNINTTPEEHRLMAMFAGGDYAASSPIEARAEFYVTSRLFGESSKFPSTAYGSGLVKTNIAEMNLVEKFAQSEGLRRAIEEANAGIISISAQPTRALALQAVVLNELKVASRDTFGIPAGGWNVSGLMTTPGKSGRVSSQARRVQDFVAATDIQTQRKRRGTNIPSGVSGKMSTPEIRKPSRPREPDNGPYTGRFLEIFNGVKDFADFRDRYRKEDVIFFDYETTGFGADGNMPVQIGAVRMRGGQVVERFNVFANPGIPLGEWAQKNLKDSDGNPLTDTWLAQQESLKGAHEKLIEFFGEDALIGGQYTPFDLEVFDRVTKDLGISYKPGGVIDSKALADEMLPRWTPDKPDGPTMVDPKTGDKKGSSSLGPLAEYLEVDLGDGWHTADADAEASALVTERMLDRAVANPDVTPRTILDPDEMPNIVERRRKKYAADMEQYERDKIDYEAAVSGKMSVPQFETANGSTYERQPDGKYKRRKDPVRSTTIDGSVVETTYDNTVFLTPDAKQAVQIAADRGRHLDSNGELMGLSYDDRNLNTPQLLRLRRDGATFDEAFEKSGGVISYYSINRSEIRESPQVGLHPFEWNTDGKKTHTGSPVSSVTRRPGNDVIEVRPASSGVSGKMSTLTPEQMTVRNESITKGIEESGGSFGDFVPDSYINNIKQIKQESFNAGGQFDFGTPKTRAQIQTDIDSRTDGLYKQIQAHIRGERQTQNIELDSRFIGYDVGFLENLGRMTPEQFKQEVRDAHVSFHAGIDPRVRVQVPIPEFISVLSNGYKTTHEMRSDHSAIGIRMPYETFIGIHPKTPANLRPASGYIVHKDWIEAELKAADKDIGIQGYENGHPELLAYGETLGLIQEGRGPVELYGGMEVILRPEVAERTKYLNGDSLNVWTRSGFGNGVPTSMTGTDIVSIQNALSHQNNPTQAITELLYGHYMKDHAASHRHMIRDGENIPVGGGSGPRTWQNNSYIEALVAGSFDSGDIEEVVMKGLTNVPLSWIFDSESKPQAGRTQQSYAASAAPTGGMVPPAIDHLQDEKKLIEKLGFTPEEARIGARIARSEFFVGGKGSSIIEKEGHLFAAIAMKEALEKKGIKFTLRESKGRDLFDPKSFYLNAGDGATAKEALVLAIEEKLRKMVREEIAEAGRKAQEQASSSEKVVV